MNNTCTIFQVSRSNLPSVTGMQTPQVQPSCSVTQTLCLHTLLSRFVCTTLLRSGTGLDDGVPVEVVLDVVGGHAAHLEVSSRHHMLLVHLRVMAWGQSRGERSWHTNALMRVLRKSDSYTSWKVAIWVSVKYKMLMNHKQVPLWS